MSKKIDNKICPCCDSRYRLVYEVEEASGFPKFCPFCSDDIYDEDYSDEEEE